eukprot:474592_1
MLFTILTTFICAVLSSSYTNPLIAGNFPDPCILHSSDGNFYIYATAANNNYIQVSQSKDAITWSNISNAMPKRPIWTVPYGMAPHVIEYKPSQYYMYFATHLNSNNVECIGVSYSTHPLGPFIDQLNKPLICSGNIDPMVFMWKHKYYIYYGHEYQLDVQMLDSNNLTQFDINSTQTITLNKNNSMEYEGTIEASWIHYKNKYFYYFFSGNQCCGSSAHYAVMVARSNRGPQGPFMKRSEFNINGTYYYKDDVIIQMNQYWVATGHNTILTDKNDNDWIYYHGYQGTERNIRMLLMDRVYYDEYQWPYINNSSPSNTVQQGPVF